jgi:hypothetical protein
MEKNGYEAVIQHDEDSMDPRQDYDHLGTMVCFHRRYCLGDVYDMDIEEAKRLEASKDNIVLPLYLYDHSGLALSTEPFSCPWDSGKLGFIYVTKEAVRKEYGKGRITPNLRKIVERALKAEVETYGKYLSGETYGVYITKDGEEVESTWGIIGYEEAEEIAQEMLDCVAV